MKEYPNKFGVLLELDYLCGGFKNNRTMKKLLLLLLLSCCTYGAYAVELKGKYISQSGELLFIFTGDSLYIDIAQSQRNISAFKLVKKSEDKKTTAYDAYESYMENGRITYREVLIRVSRLKHKKFMLEYFGKDKDRDYNSNERYTIRLVDE
jgi:hypothetical protein